MVLQTAAIPLQVPGGGEFFVIFLIFVVPLAIVGGAVYLIWQRYGGTKEHESHPEEPRIDEQ